MSPPRPPPPPLSLPDPHFLDRSLPSSSLHRRRLYLQRPQPTTSRCDLLPIAMAKGDSLRATWCFNYEKGLLDILHDHNHERFKGQNGWSPEGWRSVIKHFNEKFPSAGFSKSQIQDKEKDIKGNYKAIRAAIKESGVGWNDSLCMINASADKWRKLINDNARLKKFQAKAFPLYHTCEKLYEGVLNFTSIEPLELDGPSSIQRVNVSDIDAPASRMNSASMDDNRASSEPIDLTEAEPTSSGCSGQKGSGSGKKRSIAGVLQGCVNYKMKQSKTFMDALDETCKGDYSIKNCMDLVESIEELSDKEKAQAINIMKSEVNREIFINFTNPRVRLLWIKEEIAPKG